MMELREHYDKLAKQRETFNRILNDEKERNPSLFKNVQISIADEQTIVKNIDEPIPDNYDSATRARIQDTEAAFKQIDHPISESITRKKEIMVLGGGPSLGIDSFLMKSAIRDAMWDHYNAPNKSRLKKIKTPTTPEDFQALENARIKRESKQAKRVK